MSELPADESEDAGYGVPPEPRRVIWEMEYGDGRKEQVFEAGLALAALLMAEEISVSTLDPAKKEVTLFASCNDVFAWGCADAEEMPYSELRSLYEHHVKDPAWGVAVWCIKQRKEMPQGPVEDRIRRAGTWDMDALKAECGLRPNYYDGMSRVIALRKYAAYSAWAEVNGVKPLPFAAGWWAGWKEFAAANPGWCSDEWKAADEAAMNEWKAANGWEVQQ